MILLVIANCFFPPVFLCAIHSIVRLDIKNWFNSNTRREQFDRVFGYVNHCWFCCVFHRIFGLLRSYQREYMLALHGECCDYDACDEYALHVMGNLFLSELFTVLNDHDRVGCIWNRFDSSSLFESKSIGNWSWRSTQFHTPAGWQKSGIVRILGFLAK